MLARIFQKVFFFFGLVVLAHLFVLFSETRTVSDDEMHIWFFDIGQGDAFLIQVGNEQVLIDGGPGNEIVEYLGMVMPFWDRNIEYMVNTHPHADHVAGLVHVFDYFNVERVFASNQIYNTNIWNRFLNITGDKLEWLMIGDEIVLSNGAVLRVLWPDHNSPKRYSDPNAGSVVILLEYGEVRVLFTGDIGVREELVILDEVPKLDILKVAHQGSYTSSAREFLEKVRPDYAIIPVGDNSYGHPHKVVLNRLREFAQNIYRTDKNGSVKVIIYEDRVEVFPVHFR